MMLTYVLELDIKPLSYALPLSGFSIEFFLRFMIYDDLTMKIERLK
jgi:hypothetical protein